MKNFAAGLLSLSLIASASGCAGLARRTAEAPPPPPAPAAAPDLAKPTVTPEQARLAEQVTRIAAELAELQNALARLIAASRDQDGQIQSLQRRVTELADQSRDGVGLPRGFAPSPGGAPPPGASSPSSTAATELYQAGLAKVRAGDANAAILLLYDLIANHPEDPLRENAQFLVGDILYGQKDLRAALAEFEGLLGAVPNGSRTPDTLLKIGLCQRELGDETRARRVWERLVREYPQSVAARQARVLLRGLRQG